MSEKLEILKEEIEKLRDKLQFEEARADLMFECDCALYYINVKWALDYIKDDLLKEYPSYYGAKEYMLQALEIFKENFRYNTQAYKECLQFDGLFLAIGEKMLSDAKEDFKEIGIDINNIQKQSDGSRLCLSQSEDEKESFIEEFKQCKNPLKEELLEKHWALFEKLKLYDELRQSIKASYSNEISQEQRTHRSNRR